MRVWSGWIVGELDQNAPVVTCPGCNRPMRQLEQKPILFSNGLSDVTFVCETCGMHTIRTVKRDTADLGQKQKLRPSK